MDFRNRGPDRRRRRTPRAAGAARDQPLQGRRPQRGVHRHRAQGQGGAQPGDRAALDRPVRPEGRARRRRVRRAVRPAAATLDLSSRRISVQIRGAVSGQGIKLNLDGVAIVKVGGNEDSDPAPPRSGSSASRPTSRPSPRRCSPARCAPSSAADGRADHPRPRGLRPAGRRRVRVLAHRSGPDPRRVPDPGRHRRRLLPRRPRPARGRPVSQAASIAEANARQAAEQARIAAEQEIAIAQRPRAQAGRDQGRDRRRRRPGRCRRTARPGRPRPGDPHRAGEGRRPPGGAERAPARHPGPQARRRRALPRREGGRGRRNAQILEAEARKAASIAAAEAEAEKARLTGEGEKSRRSALAEAEAIEGAKRGEAEKARRVADAEADQAEGEAQAAAIAGRRPGRGRGDGQAGRRVRQLQRRRRAPDADRGAAPDRQGGRRADGLHRQADGLSTDGAGALPKQVVRERRADPARCSRRRPALDLEAMLHKAVDSAAGRPPSPKSSKERPRRPRPDHPHQCRVRPCPWVCPSDAAVEAEHELTVAARRVRSR